LVEGYLNENSIRARVVGEPGVFFSLFLSYVTYYVVGDKRDPSNNQWVVNNYVKNDASNQHDDVKQKSSYGS